VNQSNQYRESSLWTIVLAGGEGSRLRALTRALHGEARPKQFAIIQKDKSLLQTTLERAARWSAPAETVVVVGREQEPLARTQLKQFPSVQVVAQPQNVGTGPGVLLPLRHVLEQDPSALVVIMPSDQYVEDVGAFADSVRRAEAVARRDGSIVLIGAVPERPETQYGWIVADADSGKVSKFCEKPEPSVAQELFRTGGLWNTFIMVGPAARFWELGRRHLPRQTELLSMVGQAPASERTSLLARLYERMQPADFSRDVLQRAASLRTVELQPCGWSDWGTPERVMRSLYGTEDYSALVARLRARPSVEGNVRAEGHQAA
jgi:mannose-1-phosphate guanylyltransferase